MGLDLYVGSLTRYHVGDWLTIVQQAGLLTDPTVEINKIIDPDAVLQNVLRWQSALGEALRRQVDWPEDDGLPYWTDRPGKDGYGAVVLLAAYDEQPAHRPVGDDRPRAYGNAHAVAVAAEKPARYPSLLRGVEWWLPISGGPAVFQAPRPTGQRTMMGCVDHLSAELRLLGQRLGLTADDLALARKAGHPGEDATVAEAGRFGLAVMLELATIAEDHRQPLLMDY